MGKLQYDAERGRENIISPPFGIEDDSKMLVVALADLPQILTAFKAFSPCEQQAYLLEICQKVETPQKLANRLNWSSRGSAYNIRKRMQRKKMQLLSGTKGPFWINKNQQIEEDADERND